MKKVEQEIAEGVGAEGVRAIKAGFRFGPKAKEDVEGVKTGLELAEKAKETCVSDAEGVVGVQVALKHARRLVNLVKMGVKNFGFQIKK